MKTKFDDYLEEQLQDPEFKKEWEKIQPELEAINERLSHGNAKTSEMYIPGNKNHS